MSIPARLSNGGSRCSGARGAELAAVALCPGPRPRTVRLISAIHAQLPLDAA